jgi:hypothetical protein
VSTSSPGQQLASSFYTNLKAVRTNAFSSSISVIHDVTHDGKLINDLSMDDFAIRVIEILQASGRVFHMEGCWYFEKHHKDDRSLILIASANRVDPSAPAYLGNLVVAAVESREGIIQSLLPSKLIGAALFQDCSRSRLPEVREYARHAVFDDEFELRGPGYHPEKGILVHGLDISPVELSAAFAKGPPLERLPYHLRALLREFCWAGEADMVNALALLLTGLLLNRFVEQPHPPGLFDGNQPGVGKTIFCEALGILLDGVFPARIELSGGEELAKKIGASLRESKSSLLFFDNIRGQIESALLEQSVLSPVLSFRLLGHSANITRPNTYLWVVTSNCTSATPDLVDRALPIRLAYQGDPRKRTFINDPVEYARQHRAEILGELAGMVLAWKKSTTGY